MCINEITHLGAARLAVGLVQLFDGLLQLSQLLLARILELFFLLLELLVQRHERLEFLECCLLLVSAAGLDFVETRGLGDEARGKCLLHVVHRRNRGWGREGWGAYSMSFGIGMQM